MITKKITFDHQILEEGQIQVRQITRIMEDGKELSKTYHRHLVLPGDPTENEDDVTIKIMDAVHTSENISNHKIRVMEANNQSAVIIIRDLIIKHGLTIVNQAIDEVIVDLDLIEDGEDESVEADKKITFMQRLKTWNWES